MTKEMWDTNLMEALRVAIDAQKTRESGKGDSILVAGWKEVLLALEMGAEIRVKNSWGV